MPIRKESGNRVFSYFCRYLVRLIFSWSCRVHRLRKSQEYPSGPFIVVANHISHFDPPMLGCWFPRYIDWMAMEELYSKRWSAWLMRSLCAIPVKRAAGDFASLRAALGRLKLGRVVGIFPEGGIRAGTGSILEGAPIWGGFAGLSILSDKPVVPCVIIGTDRLYRPKNWLPFRRVEIWMGFGEAIQPPNDVPREQAQAVLVDRVRASLNALKEELVRHYGLRPDDLPQTPQYRKRENAMPTNRKGGSAG
ncbi:MAG: lysophospholipid acyltransferase family protein [Chthoniobacterales bacterium]